jgi:hypothetical protein
MFGVHASRIMAQIMSPLQFFLFSCRLVGSSGWPAALPQEREFSPGGIEIESSGNFMPRVELA